MNDTRYFREIMKLEKPGIFALVNERHKSVYISHSRSMLEYMGKLFPAMNNGTHKCRKLCQQKEYLKLVILETVTDYETRLLRFEYWVAYYREMGYKMYQYKKALEYQVKVDIQPDFNTSHKNNLVYVLLSSKRGNTKIVGVFDGMEEAKEFIKTVYSPLKQIIPIYATNTLTQEYIKYKGMETVYAG